MRAWGACGPSSILGTPTKMKLQKYLQQNPKTHLIFDFDNTLAQLQINWNSWGLKIQDKLESLDPHPWEKCQKDAISLSELQNYYIKNFSKGIRREIIKHNIWFETNCSKGARPNPKLIALIPNLNKYKKYIWTSNTKQSVEPVLKKFKIKKYFKKIVTRNDVSLLKPETEGFELIREERIPIQNYLFIGDSGSDHKAAEKLGLDFYKVNYFGLNLN